MNVDLDLTFDPRSSMPTDGGSAFDQTPMDGGMPMEKNADHLKHAALTERIIKIFYQVYNELGFGFLEVVYENAMAIALIEAGIKVVQQVPIPYTFVGGRWATIAAIYSSRTRSSWSSRRSRRSQRSTKRRRFMIYAPPKLKSRRSSTSARNPSSSARCSIMTERS